MALAPESAADAVRGIGEARSWVLKVDDGLRVEYL